MSEPTVESGTDEPREDDERVEIPDNDDVDPGTEPHPSDEDDGKQDDDSDPVDDDEVESTDDDSDRA